MNTLENIKFQGTFRNYQQRVLDNCKKYYKNNKIHIVAAPGSGKTICKHFNYQNNLVLSKRTFFKQKTWQLCFNKNSSFLAKHSLPTQSIKKVNKFCSNAKDGPTHALTTPK